MLSDNELIQKAKGVLKNVELNDGNSAGSVGAALLTKDGNVYLGINLDLCCGIGFCAEHSAVASMVTNREYEIEKIVAVSYRGNVLPPCGRCRELLYQVSKKNMDTLVILNESESVPLRSLLPNQFSE